MDAQAFEHRGRYITQHATRKGCQLQAGKFIKVWGRSLERATFGEGRKLSRKAIGAAILTRGIDLWSLEMSCSLTRSLTHTWRLATLFMYVFPWAG